MTEQTKAVFENPQILRQKLAEYFDTKNEKTIEKYAIVAEKMFEKGNKQKLKMYFNEWGFGVWAAIVSLIIVIVSLTLKYFSVNISEQITFGALGIFEFVFLCNIYVVSYRKKGVFETVSTLLNWLFIAIPFALLVIFIFYALKERALDTSFIISIIIAIFCLLVSSKYFFAKQLVIKRVALLLDNTIKNSERDAISKFFFNKDEFKKGAGKNLFGVIIGTIFFIFFIIGITISGIQKFSQKEIVNLQNTTDNTEISLKVRKMYNLDDPNLKLTEKDKLDIIELAKKSHFDNSEIGKLIEKRKRANEKINNNSKTEELSNKDKEKDKTQSQVSSIENARKLLHNNEKEKAIGILNKMCNENNGEACDFLANIIDDEQKSLFFYEKACNIGYYFSCTFASDLYSEKGNYEMAMKLIQKGCDGNDYASCMELASTQEDQEKANEIYQKANYLVHINCNNGGFGYCEMLGEMYRNGQNVTQDSKTAMKYYGKACDGKIATACVTLGFMLQENGDLVNAKEYFGKACDIGDELGSDRGCELYKELNMNGVR